jgi:hypothetical protein
MQSTLEIIGCIPQEEYDWYYLTISYNFELLQRIHKEYFRCTCHCIPGMISNSDLSNADKINLLKLEIPIMMLTDIPFRECINAFIIYFFELQQFLASKNEHVSIPTLLRGYVPQTKFRFKYDIVCGTITDDYIYTFY